MQVNRQRIQHFVRDHHPCEMRRQRRDPFDPVGESGQPLQQQPALPLYQFRADFKNPIPLRKAVARLQLFQQRQRERARTRTQFQHPASGMREDIGDLARERTSEQWGNFGRRYEIPLASNFRGPGDVIAQSRRVQHHLHVSGEGNPAAVFFDFRTYFFDQPIAVPPCVLGGNGQFGGGSVQRKGLHRAVSRSG